MGRLKIRDARDGVDATLIVDEDGRIVAMCRKRDEAIDLAAAWNARAKDVVEALRKYEAAFEAMFMQCLSNPIRDAWGNQINTSLLNEAHSSALGALNAANGHQRTPQQEQELDVMRSRAEL